MYNREQLRTENEDGVSIIFYLQNIYLDDWLNFIEHMRGQGLKNPEELQTDREVELRLWASYRGQTLVRTVKGMMYYYKALKMLDFLNLESEMSIQRDCQALAATKLRPREGENHNWDFPSISHLNTERCGVDILLESNEDAKALMKFTQVVTYQIYGAQKARKDHHANDILYLMKNYEALQIAYVDMVT